MTTASAAAETKKFNMSYLYFGSTSSNIKQVEEIQQSLDVISPNYFNINADGSLQLTDSLDREFIEAMHEQNIRVVPFISNHWNREKGRMALENREKLADEIAEAVKKYDLDGVNVDIENVTEEDRSNYTDFVRLLRKKIPSEKEISVAVAANPNGIKKGWHGSYDYEQLGKYSDYLMIMTYDESYPGGKAGPVASISFVEKSIQYALTKVPADKIVLGIPFFGRYWNNQEAYGGHGINMETVESLVNKYNGSIIYDEISKSPKASFTITSNDPTTYVLGRALTPGNYTVWYENFQSIKEKLRLVQKYNLKGTGSWSLGQETKKLWDYYSMWLNGKYFTDTVNHWAEEAIMEMDQGNLMKGTSATQFSPDQPLTRAQAAVILVKALGLDYDNTSTSYFSDVAINHWARQEINTAKKYGIIAGKGNNRFAPDEPITREQMAALLNNILRLELIESSQQNPFADISSQDWSYQSILVMNQHDIFKGFDNAMFYPRNNVTRAQMAVLMSKTSEELAVAKEKILYANID
ncbi:MAG: glycosyl hydrolase family 18 protein [Bacillota bacterium]